jgi:hypothetical protein
MPELNYSVIYFLMGKSVDCVHGVVDQLHGDAMRQGTPAIGQ